MPFKPQCDYHTSHTVSGVDLPSEPFYPWLRRAIDEATSELDSSQDGRQAHGGTVFCFWCQRRSWDFQTLKVMCWVFFQGQLLARGHTAHSPLGLWPGPQVLPLSQGKWNISTFMVIAWAGHCVTWMKSQIIHSPEVLPQVAQAPIWAFHITVRWPQSLQLERSWALLISCAPRSSELHFTELHVQTGTF